MEQDVQNVMYRGKTDCGEFKSATATIMRVINSGAGCRKRMESKGLPIHQGWVAMKPGLWLTEFEWKHTVTSRATSHIGMAGTRTIYALQHGCR